MRSAIALALCATIAFAGCATTQATRTAAVPEPELPAADRTILADYLQRLPPGSRVIATLTDNREVRGTLLRATGTSVAIQVRARVPESPREIALDQIRSVELDNVKSGGVGRAIAIGAAVGAGAALGLLIVLAAVFSD